MQVTGAVINITSDNSARLGAWYRDVLRLPQATEMGEYAFRAGPLELIIDAHSDTRGPAAEPSRVLLNLFVADIAAQHQRLSEAGVIFIRPPEQEPWGGIIATMTDPDGNYVQLVQFAAPS
ncbi:MAG: hypothetical protein DK306_002562 [Chloroflexi bacterium]|nr:MAG: hypothetical protein DK306_002562 [Chloroflexota bacterium]